MERKKSGAWLVRYALEKLPVRYTFGIPGVHNTEIYDELGKSEKIRPVLVTHEVGAAFMGDAISRTCAGEIGVLVVVPAAGITHAMSGIGEAYLDGIPLLVLSGGVRTDTENGFQLHELDQLKLVSAVTKGAWRVSRQEDIVPTIFEAYRIATSGCPGPVFVEIPANLQLFQGPTGELPGLKPIEDAPLAPLNAQLEEAVRLLRGARNPGIFVGWGGVDVSEEVRRIADHLGAPVSTTLQGLSSFPGSHPLHTGMGFGPASVPASENAFKECDCLLAIGTRFGEIPTGSFGCRVPENLIHVDIDPAAISRNFPAKVALVGDARRILPELAARVEQACGRNEERRARVAGAIRSDKQAYLDECLAHRTERVNPAHFFQELRKRLPEDALLVVDDGNHTFLAAEHYQCRKPRGFISPTDFNCMGYSVPAAVGAKLGSPDRTVACVVGDGAFLMTGLELLTATAEGAPVVCFVFHDGELSQIAQGQQIPYNRKTCTVLGPVKLEGVALATGSAFVEIRSDAEVGAGIDSALAQARAGRAVVVDVRVDYSKPTRFTRGVVKTVLKRFPLGDKVRFIGRALVRKVTG